MNLLRFISRSFHVRRRDQAGADRGPRAQRSDLVSRDDHPSSTRGLAKSSAPPEPLARQKKAAARTRKREALTETVNDLSDVAQFAHSDPEVAQANGQRRIPDQMSNPCCASVQLFELGIAPPRIDESQAFGGRPGSPPRLLDGEVEDGVLCSAADAIQQPHPGPDQGETVLDPSDHGRKDIVDLIKIAPESREFLTGRRRCSG